MNDTKPLTLLRLGRYFSPLEEAIIRFEEPLRPVASILGNTIQFGTYKVSKMPYLLMVSQQIDKILTPQGYNIILSVTSRSESRNLQIAGIFEVQTRIDLDVKVPEDLVNMFTSMNYLFPIFEKHPKEAMDELARRK
jgi:hypothetical protein